jgi:hypothetical protein
MGLEFKLSTSAAQIAAKALGGDKTALFAAAAWHRLIDPFTPMDTGTLAHDAVSYHTENGAGVIHYSAPYAYKVYTGDGRHFSQEKHPLATARWDDAAKQAGQGALLQNEIQAYLERGGA